MQKIVNQHITDYMNFLKTARVKYIVNQTFISEGIRYPKYHCIDLSHMAFTWRKNI